MSDDKNLEEQYGLEIESSDESIEEQESDSEENQVSSSPEENDMDIELEELPSERPDHTGRGEKSGKIGEVIDANTDEGITLKILGAADNLKIGQPVVIETDKLLYYCIIQNMGYPKNPVSVAERFANSPFTGLIPSTEIENVRGREFYACAFMSCVKIIEPPESVALKSDGDSVSLTGAGTREFDTIPPLFSAGRDVDQKEIETIYEKEETSESVGTLRGFEHQIPIDFSTLVKKPFGIFGRTGLGKSILNKLLCLNILKHDVSQLLLFDMQGEYGLTSRADGTKGLKFFFNDKVKIYRLGELESGDKIKDGAEPFKVFKENITSGDIIASTQSLREPSINVLLNIENQMDEGENLLDKIQEEETENLDNVNIHSLRALRNRIVPFERYKFLKNKPTDKKDAKDSIQDMFNRLKNGKSIVIDFGAYGTNHHLYFFVANMITRRLYEMYTNKDITGEELPPLIVILEEAHKFLKPSMIEHTIFDRIARETRKFQLTLAFIDQRPSQIDDEVMSQIANRFVLNLIDTKDMDTVVRNLQNPREWRKVITGLQKRECFMFGDSISVPSIIDIMDYNDIKQLKQSLEVEETLTETLEKIDKADVTKMFSKDK